jgi:3-dehydro-L-gulonate 2-dehydrogenase
VYICAFVTSWQTTKYYFSESTQGVKLNKSEIYMEKILIPFETMKSEFKTILVKYRFTEEKAEICASVFAGNSLDGVYSHGVNRFPRFIRYIQKGYVKADAEPELVHHSGAMEQWNGNLGPGPLNAILATDRVTELASKYGMGLVGLAHTNHWMRGGYYGWQAACKGYIFIGWTNTTPNMPAWGAKNPKLGNNPVVFALPYYDQAIVLDMAMSQYSFGKMEEKQLTGEKLPTPGGYDKVGNLTDDPGEILGTWRSLPIGYWKGSAFSLMLDILVTVLSGGLSTAEIGKNEDEYGVSQVFIAIDPRKLINYPAIQDTVEATLNDLKNSILIHEQSPVRYPGEKVLQIRQENLGRGIPVDKRIWEEIKRL